MATSDRGALGGYRAVLIERDGRFFFQVRELGLLASGDDVPGAYTALIASHTRLVEEARAADLLDELPPPGTSPGGPGTVSAPPGNLRAFAVKAAIIAAVGLVIVLTVASSVTGSIDRASAQLKGSMKLGHWLERELTRAARPDKALEPERQARMVSEIRVLVSRAKPFVDEIRPLFADDESPAVPDAREP